MIRSASMALIFGFLATLGCNANSGDGQNDGGASDSQYRLCMSNPNYSTLCWYDGVTNGTTKNPTCSGGSPTTLTGTVYIPAGTLPLYNARVYIADSPAPDDPLAPPNLPPIVHGATCDTCDKLAYSDSTLSTVTDINGNFTLSGVPLPPDGKAMYLVIRAGKWRRAVRIENSNSTHLEATKISHCENKQLAPELTRLPRNKREGDIPKIAVSIGNSDALECFLRGPKVGLDDSEFTTDTGDGSVNLYAGATGATHFNATLGGATFPAAQRVPASSWWDSASNWNKYDIVMLSCEGNQFIDDTKEGNYKSTNARNNLQSYINQGGRVFASHWHNGWIEGGPMPLSTVATFANKQATSMINTDIVTRFQKGAYLKQWLANANALTNGQLPINGAKRTVDTVRDDVIQPWVTYTLAPNPPEVQYFSFLAPIGASPQSQCGKMVFTDLHVSSGLDQSQTGSAFPDGCTTTTLSPQEKALIFLLFDLTNCVDPSVG